MTFPFEDVIFTFHVQFPGRNTSCTLYHLVVWLEPFRNWWDFTKLAVQIKVLRTDALFTRVEPQKTWCHAASLKPRPKNPEIRAKVTLSGRWLQHHPCRWNFHKPSFYIPMFHSIVHDYSLSRGQTILVSGWPPVPDTKVAWAVSLKEPFGKPSLQPPQYLAY